MAETPLLERLTASDLFLLMWDDYGWSSDIGGLAVLDGTSLLDRDGRVRIEAVRDRLVPAHSVRWNQSPAATRPGCAPLRPRASPTHQRRRQGGTPTRSPDASRLSFPPTPESRSMQPGLRPSSCAPPR